MSQDNQPAPTTPGDSLKDQNLGSNMSNMIQKIPIVNSLVFARSTQSTPLNPNTTSTIPLQQWVSQYQTTLDISPVSTSRKEYPNIIDTDNNLPTMANMNNSNNNNSNLPGLGPIERKTTKSIKPVEIKSSSSLPPLLPKSITPPNLIRLAPKEQVGIDQIKQFQTSFRLGSNKPSKTSINAIINLDSEPESKPDIPAPKEKKKRVQKKKPSDENETQPSKKRKTEIVKDSGITTAGSESTVTKGTTESPKKKKAVKPRQTDPKTNETKKSVKSKKKSVEATTPPNTDLSKSVVHPNMTTERNVIKDNSILLPSPQIIDLTMSPPRPKEDVKIENNNNKTLEVSSDKEKEKERVKEKEREREREKEKEKEKEKPEPPIIAINIPLINPSNPKPGQSEVVINVLKLAEDKYGWSVIHPNAKSAIDLMDEIIDDEDDGMEDDIEEDELPIIDEQGPSSGNPLAKKKKASEDELTEEQLARRHEVKMNRKVGKYDYEDPFIDDEELQWEEEITSTKDGFFVYWGPLVDDRNNTASNRKTSSKSKK